MKKFFSAALFTLAVVCPAFAVEFKASLYSETAYASLNGTSALNPDNRYDLDRFRLYNRGDVTAKHSLNEYVSGLVTLEGLYIPADIFPGQRSLTQEKIKEMYVDIAAPGFTARIGKQYLKWGGGTFFNPSSDILNHRRNPLRPLDETEGNRVAHITVPLNASVAAELAIINSDENGPRPKAVEDWAVVPKLSFSLGSLSGFALADLRQDAGPLYGTALEYVCAAGAFTDLDFFLESQVQTSTKRYVIAPAGHSYAAQKQNGDSFFLLVAGGRLQHSFSEAGWIDGITLLGEFYFNSENWRHKDYRNYINCLRELGDSSLHRAVLSLSESFANSHEYLYAGVLLQSVFIRDLCILNSAVVNLQDKSFIWIPDLYYTFASQNTTIGLRSYCFFGASRTEFGSSPLRYQAMAYLQLSF